MDASISEPFAAVSSPCSCIRVGFQIMQVKISSARAAAYLPLFPIVACHHKIELVLPGHMGCPQPGQETDDVDPLDQNSEHHLRVRSSSELRTENSEHHLLWDILQYRHPTRCRNVALPVTFLDERETNRLINLKI